MRTLLLMRHAESDSGDSQLPDHRRPLSDRGRSDALRMAQWIKHADLIPHIILASTALRVRETVGALQAGWPDPPQVFFSDELYLAASESILRRIHSDGLDSDRLMVVAHNPGLQGLVCQLAGESLPITPAAVAAFEIPIEDWSNLSARSPATRLHFNRPEELGD